MNSELRITDLPDDLKVIIDAEEIDFAVKAKRNQPVSTAVGILIFGTIWTAFISIFVVGFFGPLFIGEEVHFTSNDVPVSASIDDMAPLLFPGLFIGVFVVIGLSMLIWGIRILLQKGGYFVGTETRLIQYRNRTVKSTDWEQFSGNIEMKNKNGDGDLSMELRTGSMKSRKNSSDRFVLDKIYISGIRNVFEIEKKCRTRIKENDPTPAKSLLKD